MNLLYTFVDEVLCEMGQLSQVAVLAPHSLGAQKFTFNVNWVAAAYLCHHLGQLHSSDSWTEPSIRAKHIHAGLDQPDCFAQDGLKKKF